MEKTRKYYQWTEEDKKRLETAAIRHKLVKVTRWNKVAKEMNNPYLTASKCRTMYRALERKNDDAFDSLKKMSELKKESEDDAPVAKLMTKQEKTELLAATQSYDPDNVNFDQLSFILFKGKFSPAFLKDYYNNYLHPSINHSKWSQEEAERLVRLAMKDEEENGKVDWRAVSKKMNRTEDQCVAKFRYMTLNRKKTNK